MVIICIFILIMHAATFRLKLNKLDHFLFSIGMVIPNIVFFLNENTNYNMNSILWLLLCPSDILKITLDNYSYKDMIWINAMIGIVNGHFYILISHTIRLRWEKICRKFL